jgi:protein deglycase
MARVLVPLASGFEELEAVTILDLLVRGNIDVKSAGLESGAVRGSRGTTIVPDMTLEAAMALRWDMVVLPGGQPGATHLGQDQRLLDLLRLTHGHGGYLAAICAAPAVLAAIGLLDGCAATCYPGAIGGAAAAAIRLGQQAVVVDGRIITGRGPGSAIDFSLTLIEILSDRANRDRVEAALLRAP